MGSIGLDRRSHWRWLRSTTAALGKIPIGRARGEKAKPMRQRLRGKGHPRGHQGGRQSYWLFSALSLFANIANIEAFLKANMALRQATAFCFLLFFFSFTYFWLLEQAGHGMAWHSRADIGSFFFLCTVALFFLAASFLLPFYLMLCKVEMDLVLCCSYMLGPLPRKNNDGRCMRA